MTTKTTKILHKRGIEANLPQLDASELAYATDTEKIFVGADSGNKMLASTNDLASISATASNAYTLATAAKADAENIKTRIQEALSTLSINSDSTVDSLVEGILSMELWSAPGDEFNDDKVKTLSREKMALQKFYERSISLGRPAVDDDDNYYLVDNNSGELIKYTSTHAKAWTTSNDYESAFMIDNRLIGVASSYVSSSYRTYCREIDKASGATIKTTNFSSTYVLPPIGYRSKRFVIPNSTSYLIEVHFEDNKVEYKNNLYTAGASNGLSKILYMKNDTYWCTNAYGDMYKYSNKWARILTGPVKASGLQETKAGNLVGIYDDKIFLLDSNGLLVASDSVYGEEDTATSFDSRWDIKILDMNKNIYATIVEMNYVEFVVNDEETTIEITKVLPLSKGNLTISGFDVNKNRRMALSLNTKSHQLFDYAPATYKLL